MNPFISLDTSRGGPPPEKRERDSHERAVDARIERLLLHHARKINEGNNGVIYRADRVSIPENLLEELKKDEIDLSQGPALKLLKIYFPGAGRREYDLQVRVRDIIMAQKDRSPYVRVPYLVFYKDVELGPEAVREIKKAAPGLDRIRDRVEVLGMDYVPGEDLAQILYREALLLAKKKNLPEAQIITEEEIRRADFPWLHVEVSRIFYAKPAIRGVSELERRAAEEAVFRENFAQLMKFLRAGGLVLHRSVFDRVRETMNLLHSNGIVYRDGHMRNIMLVGEPFEGRSGEELQVFMIDFGGSAEFAGDYISQREGLYEDSAGGRNYIFDEDIVEKLRMLSEPALEDAGFDWARIEEEGRRKHKNWDAMLAEAAKRAEADTVPALEQAFNRFLVKGVEDLRYFAAFVKALADGELVGRDGARAFVEKKLAEKSIKSRPMVLTAMNELLAELKKTPS